MGATAFGYDIARQFGLKICKTNPGLVPLLWGAEDRSKYCDLAGVSAEVAAAANGPTFREGMLITHRGLSGPAVLQASSYWKEGVPIHIDLAPERDVLGTVREGAGRTSAQVRSALQHVLPKQFERELHDWTLFPSGTEGYDKAEVTTGGVDTDELSSKSMESKKVKGLFFVGEVVDVTGQLGGFNFQWAWASGAAAGRSL
jgi:predicted flavoprotein YhiN